MTSEISKCDARTFKRRVKYRGNTNEERRGSIKRASAYLPGFSPGFPLRLTALCLTFFNYVLVLFQEVVRFYH